MVRELKREWICIGLLTLIMVVKGALWSLAFPLWQGPDEDDHFAVIQFIAEMGRLPDEGDELLPDDLVLSRELADVGRLPYNPEQRQGFSRWEGGVGKAYGPAEAALTALPVELRTSFERQGVGKLMHATPLYYILAAGVYRLFDDGDLLERAQVQRWLAVLVGSPLVIVAYLIGRLLFPADGAMRLTIPTLVAFQPMISEIMAVVSVDGLLILCYTLLIYLSLRVFRDGFDWRYGLALGVVFAFGTLIKPTLNGFAPLIALLVGYDFWRARERRGEIFWGALLMGTVIIVPVGWWMARSWRLNQDLLYFNPVLKGHRILQNPYFDYELVPHMLDYYHSVWGGIFVTWWAHFGWLDTPLPPAVYDGLRGLTLLAVVGVVATPLARRFNRRLPGGSWWSGHQLGRPAVIWGFLAAAILLPVLLLQFYDLTFWWEYGNGRGLQGRYWLGTVVPMLTFFALGLLSWLPERWHPAAHQLLRAGIIVLNVVSLVGYILPRYYL